ncbi:hypothetical protein C8D87_11324 [Lentzea atacamensis]|uniref:STAS domain-containing protein n=1 Tax=Lentzea atacamensis TaxID=531938 RepID=A0ABX9DYU1_9PSEU|nr:hypothetical protein [Lentzea atacamensis]RAS59724.1 hypothetical protein C8D87_11324 [Lentzea atacamensis]
MDDQRDDESLSVAVRTRRCDGVLVTVARSDIDDEAGLLYDEVHAQLGRRPPFLVLDLRRVTFLGSTGLHALVNSRG